VSAPEGSTARLLPDAEGDRVQRLLLKKYPVARRLLRWFTAVAARLQRAPREQSAYLEIVYDGVTR
jgi:hypothetical protein